MVLNTFFFLQRSEAVPLGDSDTQTPPVNIKDEPVDEGYDAALLPQPSIKQIKEELESHEVSGERRVDL